MVVHFEINYLLTQITQVQSMLQLIDLFQAKQSMEVVLKLADSDNLLRYQSLLKFKLIDLFLLFFFLFFLLDDESNCAR